VLRIETRSRRSTGRPGTAHIVPRILHMPRLDAVMINGDSSLSNTLFRNEKHSISSVWTSSMNNTCKGSVVAEWQVEGKAEFIPGVCLSPVRERVTEGVYLVSQFGFDFASLSPAKRARKPSVLLLIMSISWRETVWTTSLRLVLRLLDIERVCEKGVLVCAVDNEELWTYICSHCVALSSSRKGTTILGDFPEVLSMTMTSPAITFF
jgi:hypothetical protein